MDGRASLAHQKVQELVIAKYWPQQLEEWMSMSMLWQPEEVA
jgi:hypothetical protein